MERNEIEENFQRVSEITEGFFALMHKKVAEKALCGSKISVEDLEVDACQEEFRDFFEIKDLQAPTDPALIREPEENDEVIVRLTYDDQDDLKTESDAHPLLGGARRSLVTATIQSGISELCGGSALRTLQGCSSSHYGANHSTIHLDGEKSANDSLHQASFFSVAEELLMKRNLQMGRGIYGGATLSQLTSQGDERGDLDCCCEMESVLSKDVIEDNVMTKSPEIVRKCARVP